MFHPQGPTFLELARQALSSTERGYDLLAPKFDYTPFRTPDSVMERVAEYLEASGSIEAAVDLCCGTGAAMEMLRPLCRRRLAGVDLSRGMLEVARRRLAPPRENQRLEFIRGNVLALPFQEEFDVAVCLGALGHILPRDERKFVQQVRKSLKPGGRFVFVTTGLPPLHSPRYLLSRGFNAAMHVRNFLVRPPFIMFYLTFLIPQALDLLTKEGFDCKVDDASFPRRYQDLRLVIATRRRLIG